MTATGRNRASLTTAIQRADFVHVVSPADGDALAASGLIARVLADSDTPFQVSVGATVGARTARIADEQDRDADGATESGPEPDTETDPDIETETADVTVFLGWSTDSVDHSDDVHHLDPAAKPMSLQASDLVREMGATPDPVLTLAGAFAAGVDPDAPACEAMLESAIERDLVVERAGVSIPTADPIDGLAHSTLVRGPWSGDLEATREALSAVRVGDESAGDEPDGSTETVDHRRLASLVAIDTVAHPQATDRSATAIARAIGAYETPAAPLETIGGFADVLEATARTAPGVGVALAMGHDVRENALECWREHGRGAHEALDDASSARYDGLFVLETADGHVETVAELAAAYRSPEPVVCVVGDGALALTSLDDGQIGSIIETLTAAFEADYDRNDNSDVGFRRGYVRFDRDISRESVRSTIREVA